MALIDIITPIADQSVDEILAIINAPSVEHRDSTHYGPGGLLLKLPPEVVEGAAQVFIAAAEQSATFKLLLNTFSTDGFDFSHDVVRSSIDTLITMGMPQNLADALKGIGRWTTSPAFDAQGHDATQEEVVAVIEQIEAQQAQAERQVAHEALRVKVANYWNRSMAFLDANPDATEEEYKAAYFIE